MKKRLLIFALILCLFSVSGCKQSLSYKIYKFSTTKRDWPKINTGFSGSEDQYVYGGTEDYQDDSVPKTYEVEIQGKTYTGKYANSRQTYNEWEPRHYYDCDTDCELVGFSISNNKLASFFFKSDYRDFVEMMTEGVMTEKAAKKEIRTFMKQYCNVSNYDATSWSYNYSQESQSVYATFKKVINGYESSDWFKILMVNGIVISMESHNLGLYTKKTAPSFNREKLESQLSSIMTAYLEKFRGKVDESSFRIKSVIYDQRKNGKWQLYATFYADKIYSFIVR